MPRDDLAYPLPAVTALLTEVEKLPLELVDGEDFLEQDVYLDGYFFRNCSFRHCRIYVKLGRFRIDVSSGFRFENNTINLAPPASGVDQFVQLARFGQLPDSP